MKKKIKIFTFAYGQGRGGWSPPLPLPYGQPDCKIYVFFVGRLNLSCKLFTLVSPQVVDFFAIRLEIILIVLIAQAGGSCWWICRSSFPMTVESREAAATACHWGHTGLSATRPIVSTPLLRPTPSQTLTLSTTSTSAVTLCLQHPWKLISTTIISALPTNIFNENTCEPIRLLPHSFSRWSGCMQIAGLCCFVVWASATTNSLSNTAHIF